MLATLVAYEPLRANRFINYDDGVYLTENPHVQAGLSAPSFAWAFNVGYAANWHPLTWLSHMLDCELWGLAPAPHHLTNLGLHAASVVVLFLTLVAATKRTGASAFVAGIFALHPLHVESVAWAAERKDVLSTLLGLLSLRVWVAWTERGGLVRYGLALGLYALGLTAKPMLVSLPFVMLLIDRWPLGRSARSGWLALAREKLPFFGLAAISCAVTFVAQKRGGAVSSVEAVPWAHRFGNVAVSYVTYLAKTVWPSGLSVFYPLDPARLAGWKVAGSILLLVAVTAVCLRQLSRRPWLGIGWLWYLGTLVPVVGIVQVGNQSMADRYTYWPMVGLSIAVAYGAAEILDRVPRRAAVIRAAAVACLFGCVLLTRAQVALWKDDLTLFAHCAAVTERNALAHYRLGYALGEIGRNEEALTEYREALRIRPNYADPYNNVGMFQEKAGLAEEALGNYRRALELDPKLAEARANLGNVLDTLGKTAEAEREMREALRQKPEMPEAHNDFGVMLAKQNRLDEAIQELREAIAQKRGYADAHMNLAKALYMHGRKDEAVENLREVLRLDPGRAEAKATLQEVIAREGKGSAEPPFK